MKPSHSSQATSPNWLSEFWQKTRGLYTIVIVTSFFLAILAIAAPVYVLQVYDRVVFQGGLTTLQALVLGMFVVIVFDFILKVIKSRIFSRISLHIDFHLGETIYQQLNRLPLRVLESRSSAGWNQIFQDQDKMRGLLSGHFAGLMIDLPFGLISLGIIGYMSLPLMILLSFIICLFIILAALSSWLMRTRSRNMDGARHDRYIFLSEVIMGRSTIKSLSLEKSFSWRWHEMNANTIDQDSRYGKLSDVFLSLSTSLTIFSTVVTTAFGALLILDQQLTIGVLIASNMLSSRLMGNLTQLVSQWRMMHQGREAWARLDKFFAEPHDRPIGDVHFPQPQKGYVLNKVEFDYMPEPAEPMLSLPSMALPHQGMITVLGNNGSGKTTLLKLLAGLYAPSKGTISLDDADIQQFSQRQINEWIGYLPQEIVLFSGTIFENIAMGAQDSEAVDDAMVIAVAKKVGLHESIVAHPEGYMRALGEGGAGLSGGQRQKLCIARLLIDDRPILLLDEPTSHLDQQSSLDMARMLAEYSKNHLVTIISHQSDIINHSDTLICLDKGRMAWGGPKDKLLEKLAVQTK